MCSEVEVNVEKKYVFIEDHNPVMYGDEYRIWRSDGVASNWDKVPGCVVAWPAIFLWSVFPGSSRVQVRREVVEEEEKPKHELVPPECHHAMAIGMTWGAKQNPDRKGEERLRELDDEKIIAKVMRHVVSHRSGTYSDSLSTLPHLLHAYVNLGLLVAKYLRHPECRFEYNAKFGACGDHGRNEL